MNSPSWKNPAQLPARRLRSRRSNLLWSVSNDCLSQSASSPCLSVGGAPDSANRKRKNPFRKSPLKSVKQPEKFVSFTTGGDSDNTVPLENDENAQMGVGNESPLFAAAVDFSGLMKYGLEPPPSSSSNVSSPVVPANNSFGTNQSLTTDEEPPSKTSAIAPMDLRLSTRLKLSSDNWCFTGLKTGDLGQADALNTKMRVQALCAANARVRRSSSSCSSVSVGEALVTAADHMALDDSQSQTSLQLGCSSTRTSTSVQSDDLISELSAAAVTYQFPYVPWMSTFPRVKTHQTPAQHNTPSIAKLGDPISKALRDHWHASFDSLFFLTRFGRVNSFYMCCTEFTVLFANWSGVEANSDNKYSPLTALITPTTEGFRRELKENKIEFEQPFVTRRTSACLSLALSSSPSNTSLETISCTAALMDCAQSQPALQLQHSFSHEPECNKAMPVSDSDEDDDDDLWMANAGASPSAAVKLRRTASMADQRSMQGSNSHLLGADGKLQEKRRTVCTLSGVNVRALYQFLKGSELCHTRIGPQAGLPPTLICEQPFEHSTLVNAKVQRRIQKSTAKKLSFAGPKTDAALKEHHVVELSGVLLPSAVSHILHIMTAHLPEDSAGFEVNGHELGRQAYVGANALAPSQLPANTIYEDWTQLTYYDRLFHWN